MNKNNKVSLSNRKRCPIKVTRQDMHAKPLLTACQSIHALTEAYNIQCVPTGWAPIHE